MEQITTVEKNITHLEALLARWHDARPELPVLLPCVFDRYATRPLLERVPGGGWCMDEAVMRIGDDGR